MQRYASLFPITEINSSFHRPHRPTTWERWRDSVPDAFRFSVKLPKTITHQRKLADCAEPLAEFIDQVRLLGDKLAVLLVQLPPKLAFDAPLASAFFVLLANQSRAQIACEPRHPSWFSDQADALLDQLNVACVAADPAICGCAAHPGGWRGLSYWRLHGSPVIYRSSYIDRLDRYADLLRAEAARGADVWCIFDNTASSAAANDALVFIDKLGQVAH